MSLPPFQNLAVDDPNAKDLLGPLFDFIGTWTNENLQGWNLIAVPGPVVENTPYTFFNNNHGFYLETIPYIETISFTPIAVTLNRGPFVGSETEEQVQKIGAILYEQRIASAGVDSSNKYYDEISAFFETRGFSKGTPLHAEQGMLLNITNYEESGTDSLQVARMGTIPHGNTMLCLGSCASQNAPSINPEGTVTSPSTVDPKQSLPLEYGISTYQSPDHSAEGYPFYPNFLPTIPNQTLVNANKGVKFLSTNHIELSTENGTGGILNIPFVSQKVGSTGIDTTKMKVDYWVSKIQGEDGNTQTRIQYVQNINLVFPATGAPDIPINWPHIGMNTLHKVN